MKKLSVSSVLEKLIAICKKGKEDVYYDYLPLLSFKKAVFKEQIDFFMCELINNGCKNFVFVEAMDGWEFDHPKYNGKILVTFIPNEEKLYCDLGENDVLIEISKRNNYV